VAVRRVMISRWHLLQIRTASILGDQRVKGAEGRAGEGTNRAS
jgi:hypothetical protein